MSVNDYRFIADYYKLDNQTYLAMYECADRSINYSNYFLVEAVIICMRKRIPIFDLLQENPHLNIWPNARP